MHFFDFPLNRMVFARSRGERRGDPLFDLNLNLALSGLRDSARGRNAFTLIEMLVSITILTILWVMISEITGLAFRTTQVSLRSVGEVQQARFVLDRIGYDLSLMPHRRDMDYHFTNAAPGEDSLRFISRIKGWNGDRELSLIAYQMRGGEDSHPMLYRGVKGYRWSDRGFMGMNAGGRPQSLKELPGELDLKASEYDLISEAVFKMETGFLRKSDGRLVGAMPEMTNIASMVVSIAILDAESRKIVKASHLMQLSERLGHFKDGETPMQRWSQIMDTDFKGFSEGVPLKAAQAVQVFERFYPMK